MFDYLVIGKGLIWLRSCSGLCLRHKKTAVGVDGRFCCNKSAGGLFDFVAAESFAQFGFLFLGKGGLDDGGFCAF